MTFTNFTEKQYNDRYGTNLSTDVAQDETGVSATTRRIDEACDMILSYAEDNSPGFDSTDLTTAENTILQNAGMMQLKFMLEETNYASMSGYDAIKGTMGQVPHEISREARKYLESRIIFRGL